MSYDISIVVPEYDKPCPHCGGSVERVPESTVGHWDPTYNYGPMFRAALDNEHGIHDWNGKPVAVVADQLLTMVQTMLASPAKFKAYDASNGWGTYADLLPFLRDTMLPSFVKRPATSRTRS